MEIVYSLQEIVLENRIFTLKRMNLDPYLTPFTKTNLQCIKDLKIRPKTIKFLEENRGKTPYHQSRQ